MQVLLASIFVYFILFFLKHVQRIWLCLSETSSLFAIQCIQGEQNNNGGVYVHVFLLAKTAVGLNDQSSSHSIETKLIVSLRLVH